MTAPWPAEWLQDTVQALTEPEVWRGVETQYASSSLQLVDSHAEHDVLEQMLEASKPPLPDDVRAASTFCCRRPSATRRGRAVVSEQRAAWASGTAHAN